MPSPGYGHMELLRLSPRTGEALRRLNLFQGQILHGRIFHVGPLAESGGGSGLLAKIAIGSQLIEAVISEPLPEGASVSLEVLRISDDSLILRLLEIEAPKQNGSQPTAHARPDRTELSPEALDTLGLTPPKTSRPAESPGPLGLVEPPEWAALPRNAAAVLRAAIDEGFVDPASFASRVPTARVVIHTAMEQYQAAVANRPVSVSGASRELAESILTLIEMVRPMIASLPIRAVQVVQSIAHIARELAALSSALRPTPVFQAQDQAEISTAAQEFQQGRPIPARPDTASVTPAPHDRPTPARSDTASVTPAPHDRPMPTPQSRAAPPGQPADGASSRPETTSRPPQTTPPGVREGAGPTAPAEPAPSSSTKPIPAPEKVTPLTWKPAAEDRPPTSSTDSPRSESAEVSGADARSARHRAHPARQLLLGLRTLSSLASRFAREGGWSGKEATTFSGHAARLSTLADAWEGVLLAPLLTRSLDVPDAVPRLLLSILFPGGAAELGVFRADRDGSDGQEGRQAEREVNGDERECVGIIRLTTDALGSLNVRLDYKEVEDGARVGGVFGALGETADAVRAGLPTLDGALKARGLVSDGFRVRTLDPDQDVKSSSLRTNAGGLDIQA